jgi:hypothetical protein
MVPAAGLPVSRPSAADKARDIKLLKRLWAEHDRMERQILLLERKFTDAELKRLGAAAGGD